jgi:hypothetical protein
MAGADKFLLGLVPGNGTSQMGAFTGQGQEPAAFKAHQVKLSGDKSGNRSWCIGVCAAGINAPFPGAAGLLLGGRSEKREDDQEKLSQGNQAKAYPQGF